MTFRNPGGCGLRDELRLESERNSSSAAPFALCCPLTHQVGDLALKSPAITVVPDITLIFSRKPQSSGLEQSDAYRLKMLTE